MTQLSTYSSVIFITTYAAQMADAIIQHLPLKYLEMIFVGRSLNGRNLKPSTVKLPAHL